MNIVQMVDHTLLRANATKQEISRLLSEAREYGFASVCVNPTWVSFAAEELRGSHVKVCTVIGFPLGAATTAVKAFEAQDAVQNGAKEIDMVINIGAVKDGEFERVFTDIQAVVKAVQGKALVKVIIETCLLTDEEKVRVTEIVVKAGADFVKTSTGFSTGGATIEDVAILRKAAGPAFGVKAAGGIRSLETAKQMIAAGATRIGTSAGVKFVEVE
jgi:deoxyribose-phosphate aldolase